jgi:NDP-hexose 4-ketoreductase
MEIIGTGFIARSLAPVAAGRRDVVVLAAGVSAARTVAQADFDREAELLYLVMDRCQQQGRRLVFFSTASAGMYSVPGQSGRESGPVRPATAYGRHKLALEAVLAASSLSYLVLRLGHVVGRRQPPHQLLPALVGQVLSGRVSVHRGARRDLIDIADVVRIVDRLLGTTADREVVNVATGTPVAVEKIIDRIESALGRCARRDYTDVPPAPPVSTAKLRELVPSVVAMGFGPDYPMRVLERHIPSYLPAAASRAADNAVAG